MAKTSTIIFPDIDYEISSDMFLAMGELEEGDIYDKKNYNVSVNDYCSLFPTTIDVEAHQKAVYPEESSMVKHI